MEKAFLLPLWSVVCLPRRQLCPLADGDGLVHHSLELCHLSAAMVNAQAKVGRRRLYIAAFVLAATALFCAPVVGLREEVHRSDRCRGGGVPNSTKREKRKAKEVGDYCTLGSLCPSPSIRSPAASVRSSRVSFPVSTFSFVPGRGVKKREGRGRV